MDKTQTVNVFFFLFLRKTVFGKGLVFKVYKEIPHFNNKNTSNLIKNEQNVFTDTS